MDQQPQNDMMMNQPMTPEPKKSGHGGLVAVIIIILIILGVILFWPQTPVEQTMPVDTTATETQQPADDFSSLEAELEATNIDGVSDSL